MGLVEIKQQIVEARQQIAGKRSQAEAITKKLEEARKALPSATSQRALREKYAGLRGREFRRKIFTAEEGIETKRVLVKDYLGEIKKYEREQIDPVARQVAAFEAEKAGFERAKEHYLSGHFIPIQHIEDPIVQKYYREFKEQQMLSQDFAQRLEEIKGTYNIGGVEALTEFEKKTFDVAVKKGMLKFEKEIVDTKLDEIQDLRIMIPKIEDRTDRIQVTSRLTGLGILDSMFPSVSAAPTKDLKGLTTFDGYGLVSSRGIDRAYISKDISVPSRLGDLDSNRTGVGRFILGLKETFKSDITGMATLQKAAPIVTAETYFGQGTPTVIRGQTPEEWEKIQQVQITGRDVKGAILDVPFFRGTLGTTREMARDVPFYDRKLGEAPQLVYEGLKDIGKRASKIQAISPFMLTQPKVLRETELKAREIMLTKVIPIVGRETTRMGVYAVPVVGVAAISVEGLSLAERSRIEKLSTETNRVLEEAWKKYQLEPAPEGDFRKLTKQEFFDELTGDVRTQLRAGIKKEAIFLGGALVAGGLLFGAGKLIKYLRKPIYDVKKFYPKTLFKRPQTTIYQPSEKVKIIDVKITEEGALKIIKPKVIDQTKQKIFAIAEEIQPGQITTKTSLIRRFFGKKPKVIDVQKQKYTLKYFEGEGIASKTGKEEPVLSLIGKTETETAKLPGYKGGRRTFEYVNVPIIKDTEKGVQSLAKIDKGFISAKGGEYNLLSQEGKTTKIFRQVSKSEPTGRESKAFVEYVQGDVNLRLAPRFPKKGRVSSGLSDVYIEKKTIPEEVIEGFKGGGKQSSQEYFQKLYAPEQKFVSAVSKIIKPTPIKTPKVILETPKTTTKDFPLMVGGLGLVSASKYTGTGLYERTEVQTMPSEKIAMITSPAVIDIAETKVDVRPAIISMQKPGLKVIQVLKTQPLIRTEIKTFQQPMVGVSAKTILKTLSKLKTTTITVPKSKPTLKTSTQPKPRPTPLPKPIIIPIKPKQEGVAKKMVRKLFGEDGFKVFARKEEKDIKIGEFETLGEAKKTLLKRIRRTLRASGFIETKGGKRLSFRELGIPGTEFRPGKKELFRVVQRKTRRFGTGGETKEAQFFRKKKKKSLL